MKFFVNLLILLVLIIVCIYLFFYFADTLLAPATVQSPDNKVCFSSGCFSVQLAKTNAERERGLMNVDKLDENSGMLFIFEKEGIYPFWMKDTLIPLDIIWIGENQKVAFIGKNIQPCKTLICPATNPLVKARYVLEVNSGIAEKTGLKVGDSVELKIKD